MKHKCNHKCKHEKVEFCKDCGEVFCLGCGVQFEPTPSLEEPIIHQYYPPYPAWTWTGTDDGTYPNDTVTGWD